jgi:hypothetical protein
VRPALARVGAAYASAFPRYLEDRGEATLRAAYELGREAVAEGLGVLELAAIHHDVLAACVAAGSEDAEAIVRAGADFFVESLSAFEMVQRGYREAREAASLERRHGAMLRQLSSFLADASLALGASDSLEEMLRLVAEQARELLAAEACVAAVALDGMAIQATALWEDGADDERPALDLSALDALARSIGGPARMSAGEVARHAAFRALPLERPDGTPLAGWLAAPLSTLDGRELGWIHVLDKREGEFADVDEAVLVHLAQLASAAVERAWLYRRPARPRRRL